MALTRDPVEMVRGMIAMHAERQVQSDEQANTVLEGARRCEKCDLKAHVSRRHLAGWVAGTGRGHGYGPRPGEFTSFAR